MEHGTGGHDERTWQDVRGLLDEAARQRVRAAVDEMADVLSARFYRHMMADETAAPLLDQEMVNRRLRASMARWMRRLFDPAVPIGELAALQRHVGDAHARIGVPAPAVASGFRLIKRGIAERVLRDASEGAATLQYVYEMVDLAMDVMSDSMLASHGRLSRSDESYRLFFLSRNLRAERERQRSHLLEWINELLLRHYWQTQPDVSAAELPSPFEQWVTHKAELLFQNEPELATLREGIRRVRHELLPRLHETRGHGADARERVTELHHLGDRMKATLTSLFDRAAALEHGRDDLTQLLSRRYLPAILRREIGLAQSGGRPFALLLLELDGFEHIAQALGSEAGDLVLAQAADCVVENVRASDFAFRFGAGRLLLLVVDARPDEAVDIALGLCRHLDALVPRIAAETLPQLAAHVGVAPFDGHPDYQRLIERADQALHEARGAPDRHVVVAPRTE